MQLQISCNLSFATGRISSCMCRMQLETSCIRQLQNAKFLVVSEGRVLCCPIVSRPSTIHTMWRSSHLPLQSTTRTNPLSNGNNIHRWSHARHVPTPRTFITHQHMGCSTSRPTQHTPQVDSYHCQTWVNCTIHIWEVTWRTIMHMVLLNNTITTLQHENSKS
jgi:hypothetical protein